MMAVANGHTDTVLYLIANGAIVNAKDSQGRTSLHRGVSPFGSLGMGSWGVKGAKVVLGLYNKSNLLVMHAPCLISEIHISVLKEKFISKLEIMVLQDMVVG